VKKVSKYGHNKSSYIARACTFDSLRSLSASVLVLVALVSNVALAQTPVKKASKKSAVAVSSPNFDSTKAADRLQALELDKRDHKISTKTLKERRLSEKSPLVRHRINQALALSDSPEIVVTLVDSLQNDVDPMVRQGAAQSLSQYANDPVAAQALAAALDQEKTPSVRYAIALSLCLSQTEVGLSALNKAAKDSDVNVRKQIAFGLRWNPSKDAVKILKKFKSDKEPSVRELAKDDTR
jgi:HEAT repeat protein